MRFFFDNNLPPKLAKSLHVLVEPHHQVVHLKEKFAANATDETWMLKLAKEEDWVIISVIYGFERILTRSQPGDQLDTRLSS